MSAQAFLRPALERMGLLAANEDFHALPLTGGVSSDIWKIDTAARSFVVKRALAQLKVAAEWRAPVGRNEHEFAWFQTVAAITLGSVPDLLGHDRAAGLFAMAYLAPDHHPVWKSELRDGRVSLPLAHAIGDRLGLIHGATAGRDDVARQFATGATFHAIRLEPYLEATARRHPALSEPLMDLSVRTLATERALVHGDISPKNILAGPDGPVFLDAECAWYGDPAFDLAFCLNHLLLKCLWTPAAAPAFLQAFDTLAAAYMARVDWEPPAELETRAASLLPALLLARIDGKSPVEYLTAADAPRVRRVALPLIAGRADRVGEVRARWAREVGQL